jgi:hypothetical protein
MPSGFHETQCRSIISEITSHDFPKARPKWLINPLTGKPLELDGYNQNLKIAFEYNGIQHYKFVPRFHKSPDDLILQRMRDIFKQVACKRYGIALIIIPYHIHATKLRPYISQKLKSLSDK